jgi:hypothetical protein
MSYSYEEELKYILTVDGVKTLLKIRNNVDRLLGDAGAFKLDHTTRGLTGDSFTMLGCIDYLENIGEIKRITTIGPRQDDVYVRGVRV